MKINVSSWVLVFSMSFWWVMMDSQWILMVFAGFCIMDLNFDDFICFSLHPNALK